MRMILYISKKAKRLIALLFFFASIGAYPQTCEVTLHNDFLIDANNLIVDIYVKATSGNFYYSQGQYKVQFDVLIKNGGTITGAIVPGYSDLTNSAQIPTAVNMTTSTFRVPTEFQPSTQAACSQISTTGFGTRICRVKLTNTVAFGVLSANMTLLTTTGVPTTVWYTNSSNFGVEIIPTTAVNTNLVNPILNGTLTAYNVTGSGAAPAAVGLDGSQTGGVNYVLYKSAVPQGASIDGTGSAITFGTQPEGTYTVKGHRKATFMYSDMTGNAIVTPPDPTTYAVTGGGSYCQGGVGLPVGLANSESGVIYTLIKDGVDQVPTVTGTGTLITFGNQLFGTYTVRGTNGSSTIAMEGSAYITVNTLPTVSTASVTPTSVCVSGQVVFSATASAGTIKWYTALTGGTEVTVLNPTINATATYYAEATSPAGCVSAARTAVTATVNTLPTVSMASVTPTSVCGSGQVVFSATASAGTIKWYTALTGVTVLNPIINATTTYYAEATSPAGCVSAARTAVTATVNTTPGAPTVGTITQPTCAVASGSVVLSGLPTGTWVINPGSIAGSTTSTTISGLATETYTYTVTNSSGCTSVASANVVIEVVKTGVVPKIKVKWSDVLICYNLGDSIKSYQWYNGVDPISNATSQYYQTKGQSGTYKVETIDKNWCVNFSNEISTSGTKSLSVYPNPASVSFALKLNDESEGRAVVSIINPAGIKVMEFQVENINDELLKEIPVNNLDEGIYVVQVLLDNKDLYYTKIIVIK